MVRLFLFVLRSIPRKPLKLLAVPARLELATFGLGNRSRSAELKNYFLPQNARAYSEPSVFCSFSKCLNLLARPERFELPTPRFVVWRPTTHRERFPPFSDHF